MTCPVLVIYSASNPRFSLKTSRNRCRLEKELMKRTTLWFVLLIVIASLPGSPRAYLRTLHFNTDTELMRYLSESVFTAEGRIGDLSGPEHELDMGQSTMDLVITASYEWHSGVSEPFSLVYDYNTETVVFSLGGRNLHYSTEHSGFDVIFVRTRAVDGGTIVTIDNLVLNGQWVNDFTGVTGPDGRDVLLIYGVTIARGFALTGTATLSWTGNPPVDQRLAFQIKVARSAVVATESSTWSAIKSLYR